jgi:hypothetical protein
MYAQSKNDFNRGNELLERNGTHDGEDRECCLDRSSKFIKNP